MKILKAALIIIGVSSSPALAAELKVLTPRALWTVLNETGAEFERSAQIKLAVESGIAPTLARRIQDGEYFDVFIGPTPLVNSLLQTGKLRNDSRVPLARSGVGMSVRAGAPKPDIDSVEAFKRTLLNAKSIAYLKTGASGVYLAGLMERLGLASAIEPKLVRPETDIVSEMVAKGEVEIGLVVITQILTTPGIDLVGPIPEEVQHYVQWDGAVSAGSSVPEQGAALLSFLKQPRSTAVMKRQGMEASGN